MGTGLRSFFTFALCFILYTGHAQKSAIFWDPAREYKEALEIYDQQKYNIAYNRFYSFIESYEEEDAGKSRILLADAYYYKASCASKQDDPKAEDYYLAYIDRFKGHSLNNAAYYDLGNIYFDERDFRSALDYYNRVDERALSKQLYEGYAFRRGFCYFSLKEFSTARLAWQELIGRPESEYYYDANYYYGMAAYYQQDYDAAVAAFQKADKDVRYRDVVPYYIAQIRFIKGDHKGVIEYAVPLLERSGLKYKPEINQLVGQSYFKLGDYANAVVYLEQFATTAKSLTKEDYYQLGYAQYHTADYAGAVESFKELNHLDNALAQNALFLTANAYLKLGDKENARLALNRAASLDHDPAIVEEARFNYAKLSYELGFTNEALVSLRKFLEDYPASGFVDEANGILAELLLQTRNYDEALAIIEQIKNPSPRITQAYQLMAYHKGISLYNEGLLNKAMDAFNKALRYTPDKSLQSLTRYWMGDIQHRKQEYAGSITNIAQFLSAAAEPEPGHSSRVSKATGHYVQGYNHYKLGDYANARAEFEKASDALASGKNEEIRSQLLPDALLRTADCYYLARNYDKSTAFYDKVVNKGYEGSDYALFQKAAIEGLQGRYERKIEILRTVMTTYPSSVLADDALYETGNTYVVMENTTQAVRSFDDLIRKYPSSEWVAPSYLKLGLIYFNQDQYDEALKQYKIVVSQFPKTISSSEALLAIRDVYIAKGDPQGYIKFIEKVPGATISAPEQDSLIYLSAENLFTKGNYEKALEAFNDYLLRYPDGFFSLPAHFYRGECHFSFQDSENALRDYDQVLSEGKNRFTERSLQRAAGINYYHFQKFAIAREQYLELMQIATTEDNRRLATLGLLRSNFQLSDYRSTIEYAVKVIGDAGFTEMQLSEAYFYRARAYWNTGERQKAVSDYTEVRKSVSNEWAAEAVYQIALDHQEKGRLDEAEATCFEFIREYPSYASWLVRTYLLLADVYIARENLFQARATVQSILDNYTQDDQWRALAEAKYAEIERLEQKGSKIDTGDGDDDQLKFDE